MAAHNENLRFDRRLRHRRGWISEKELARHLRSLPDVEEQGEWVDPADDAEAAESTPEAAAPDAPGPGADAPGAAEAAADAPQSSGE